MGYLGVFIIGVLVGFVFLAIVATGKHRDMLSVIQATAINDDSFFCRDYLRKNGR